MPCPALLEAPVNDGELLVSASQTRSLPPCVNGDPICPMTSTTTCTPDEDLQRKCPSC